MDLGIAGRKAIVTGASRGIGSSIAEALLREGAEVAICGRDVTTLAEGAKRLGELGTIHTYVTDMAVPEDIRTFVADGAAAMGGIDIVVSNVSGLGGAGVDAWRRNFEVDVLGYVELVQAALPYLERSTAAAVVAIGTSAAVETFGGNPAGPYGALKAAVIHHSSGLAQTLAGKGIRVNTVSPGPVYFEGGSWETIKQQNRALYDSVLSQIARGTMGTPEEIANCVVFLASPAAGYVTGVNLVADGGLTKKIKF